MDILYLFRICDKCGESYLYRFNEWCLQCMSSQSKNNFKEWTSENSEIDKFLQNIQLNANSPIEVIEWIPYKRLFVKKQIGEGGYGTVNLANWLDGPITSWNKHDQKLERNACYQVALKTLNKSNKSSDLLKEVSC